jgi:DUF1680 family protein
VRKHVIACAAATLLAGAVMSAVNSFGQAGSPPPATRPTAGVAQGENTAQAGGGTGSGVVTPNANRGRGRDAIPDPNAGLTNLALVATPAASHVSGDTTVTALNDGVASNRGGSRYGNWPTGGTQWVEYTWSQPVSTNKADVLWWDDNQGVRLPRAARLKYWNGSEFVPLQTSEPVGVSGNTFNVINFPEITTNRIRLEMDAAGGPQISTGIIEFRVFDSGKSPAFPPLVKTGMDRVVVISGKTYLSPTIKQLKAESSAGLEWSKESGPGTVSFADPKSGATTATFSVPGDYVLKLTAKLGTLSNSDTVKVKAEAAAPAKPLLGITTTNYTLDSKLWEPRIKAQIVSWIPHCVDLIEHPEHLPRTGQNGQPQGPGGLDNFIEAAKKLRGEPAARHKGYVFSNAWVHNIVESMCLANMVDAKGDPEILKAQEENLKTLDRWIPIILAAQEPDGYLQTSATLDGWSHFTPRFRGNHEGYVMGYFLESAEAHFHLTKGKDRRLYDAAKKCADCWVNAIGPGKNEWYDGHQEMEKALVRFGRLVNEVEGAGKGQKYIDLAKQLLDNRSKGTNPQEYDQSHVPVVQQYEAVGHAVRASYTYAGMAAVMAETSDLDYQSATKSLWDNIVNKKLYLTGGIGSGETSEGFGPNYSLRNNSYCESCSNCGQIFFQYNMNLAFHDAKYVDLYEDALYNAVLGDVDLAGKNFCYTNPLDQNFARYAWHGCPCCVGNIPRTLIMLPTWTYSTSSDSIYVNMFIGSTMTVPFNGQEVKIQQQTNYPWDGKVTLTVNPAESKNFALRIRVPNRQNSDLYKNSPEVKGMSDLAVNGQRVANPQIQDGYAVITRDWKAGDKVEFNLPLDVQKVTAIEQVAADRGKMALRRGPIIYNVEAVDNANLNGAANAGAAFTAEWRPDLLEGVVAINGQWADDSKLLAIPNYARNNRGGRSIVWFNAQRAPQATP